MNNETKALREQYDEEVRLRHKELYAKSREARRQRISEYQIQKSDAHEKAIEAQAEAIKERIKIIKSLKDRSKTGNVDLVILKKLKLD